MAGKPEIKPRDWITIGDKGQVEVVVCRVYESKSADEGDAEVVYLDDRDQAINEYVKWAGKHWKFAKDGSCGGYADKYPRLRDCVAILQQGRMPR